MDNLIDIITSPDARASDISDKIKEILYMKAADRVEAMKPYVAASVFSSEVMDDDDE